MLSKAFGKLEKYNIKNYQFGLVIFVVILSVFGAFMVDSARSGLFERQIMGVAIGFVAMIIISLIDYKFVLKYTWILYVFSTIMLVAVLLWGIEVNGARRWLRFGEVLSFQPSDLTKIILILFFAYFFMRFHKSINKLRMLLASAILVAPSIFLIHQQPNLSNTITLAILFCLMLFMAGLSYKMIGLLTAIIAPFAIIFLFIALQPNQPLLADYQQQRLLAFLNPQDFVQEAAYQQLNSVMAIGSGQLTGKGFNNDLPTSLKNSNFVPEPHNDFIFAVIGEELGFIGSSIVIVLLLLIILMCILIGIRASDLAGRLICGGVAALISIQAFINIGVATLLLPNTGISLPFVSYGLTSVISFYMGIGFVLNVGLQPSKHANKYVK
jgi:rod shape determining protein RodA